METAVALGHLATALAIGLLLGVEREHDNAHNSTRPAGSRTFPLIALAGAVSAALSPVALGVALGAVAALVIAWYLRTSEPGAAADWLGVGGVVAAGALGGLADAHAAASLAPQSVPVHTAVLACGAALATNTVVKLVLATVAGGPGFALRLAAWLAPVIVAVGLGMAW